MKKLKYTWKQFDTDCRNLIRRIRYADFKPKTIVGIATGGLPLGTKLKNKLKVPLIIISAESYKGRSKGNLAFNVSFTKPLQSPVLLVDDIVEAL
jgi:hypoxanthine phosphoribosyltransferase